MEQPVFPVKIDEELEPVFLSKWRYIDLLRPQRRISWKEAEYMWYAGVFDETILASQPCVVNIIIKYCGNIQDNVGVRSMVYVSARAADRRDMWVNSFRYPTPLYKRREVESELVWPIRTTRMLCCCTCFTYIYAYVLYTLWLILFGLVNLFGFCCISCLQVLWIFRDWGAGRYTKGLLNLICWPVWIFITLGMWSIWIVCSPYMSLIMLPQDAQSIGIYREISAVFRWINEVILIALEREEHPAKILCMTGNELGI